MRARTEGLADTRCDGSRGLEERGDAVAFVPAARRRDGTAGGVAPDAADCEPLKREGLTTKLTTRGAVAEKAPQRKSLQGLIFTQSGRRDLNSTAPKRGRCFIGTYVRHTTAVAAIGSYGPANITANMIKAVAAALRRQVKDWHGAA